MKTIRMTTPHGTNEYKRRSWSCLSGVFVIMAAVVIVGVVQTP